MYNAAKHFITCIHLVSILSHIFLLGVYICTGSVPLVLTSLEKRFKFSSVQAGSIGLMIDVAVLLSVVFVSYFGERSHKPRWLGVSLIIQGVACLLFTLPQWIFGNYIAGSTGELQELCMAEGSGGNATEIECSSANYTALVIFLVANFILGIGISPLFTIGTAFLDDIFFPKYVPLCMGLFYSTTVIGPVLGFVIGGSFLSFYVDPSVETRLSPTDPAWVGAWWMPFLVTGIMSFLVSIPFFMFPRQLPNSAAIKAERMKEMAKVLHHDLTRDMNFKDTVKAFPQHLKQLILNPSFMFLAFALGAMFLLISGTVDFSPKYLETQFSLTATAASYVVGVHGVTGSG